MFHVVPFEFQFNCEIQLSVVCRVLSQTEVSPYFLVYFYQDVVLQIEDRLFPMSGWFIHTRAW